MKRICKKFLIFLFIFTTFIGGAFASSRPAPGTKEEQLLEKVRSAVRFLSSYHVTNDDIEGQNEARRFLNKVLSNKKFSVYVPLAFDDVDKERIESYNKALTTGDPARISAMQNGIDHTKSLRKQFGL